MSGRRRKRKLPYMPFYTNDYMGDEAVMSCSLAAQGLWMRMLCVMWNSPERGVLKTGKQPWDIKEIAVLTGDLVAAQNLVNELLKNGVTERRKWDGAYINRRMIRDQRVREKVRKRVRKHRDTENDCNAVRNANVTGKSEVIFHRSDFNKSSSDDDPLTLLPELQRKFPDDEFNEKHLSWAVNRVQGRANSPPGSLAYWRKALVEFFSNWEAELAAYEREQAGAIEAHAGHNPHGRAN